jgi:hypothetical protein
MVKSASLVLHDSYSILGPYWRRGCDAERGLYRRAGSGGPGDGKFNIDRRRLLSRAGGRSRLHFRGIHHRRRAGSAAWRRWRRRQWWWKHSLACHSPARPCDQSRHRNHSSVHPSQRTAGDFCTGCVIPSPAIGHSASVVLRSNDDTVREAAGRGSMRRRVGPRFGGRVAPISMTF